MKVKQTLLLILDEGQVRTRLEVFPFFVERGLSL